MKCVLLDALSKWIPDINKVFEGKLKIVNNCLDIEFKSEKEESFQELNLNVKGVKDIYESV